VWFGTVKPIPPGFVGQPTKVLSWVMSNHKSNFVLRYSPVSTTFGEQELLLLTTDVM
jgi:hypothetical protein